MSCNNDSSFQESSSRESRSLQSQDTEESLRASFTYGEADQAVDYLFIFDNSASMHDVIANGDLLGPKGPSFQY